MRDRNNRMVAKVRVAFLSRNVNKAENPLWWEATCQYKD